MKPEFENIPLVKTDKQYEIEIDGAKAFIVYRESDATITLIHTEVEDALQGRGASTAVIEKTLQKLRIIKKAKNFIIQMPSNIHFINPF